MNGTSHLVHITVEINGKGTTSPSGVVEAWWNPGVTITFTAYPELGWNFDHWDGVASGTDNPITFDVPQVNSKLTATFIEVTTAPSDVIYESFLVSDYPDASNMYFYAGNNTIPMTDPSGYFWAAQIFRPQISHKLTKVTLLLNRNGTGGLFYLSIQPTKDGISALSGLPIKIPTGDILTRTEVDGNQPPSDTNAYFTYSFAKKVWLEKDVDYAMVLQADVNFQNTNIGRLTLLYGSWYTPTWDQNYSKYPHGYSLWSNNFGATWNTGARPWDAGDPPDSVCNWIFAEYGNTQYPLTAVAKLSAVFALRAKVR